MSEDNFIDVDFNEEFHESTINGKPLYYTTSQVGQMIGETDSTIRFWCGKFKDIVKPEMSGSHRRFKEEDVEKLKYIKKLLRDDGYSINQVIEFAGTTDTSKSEIQIQKKEPLAMQALATALSIQIANDLEEYKTMLKEEILTEVKQGFKENNELQQANQQELKEYLSVTIQDSIKDQISDIKTFIDTQELEAKKRDEELIDIMKKGMEEREKATQELGKEKRGIFGRLFGK